MVNRANSARGKGGSGIRNSFGVWQLQMFGGLRKGSQHMVEEAGRWYGAVRAVEAAGI